MLLLLQRLEDYYKFEISLSLPPIFYPDCDDQPSFIASTLLPVVFSAKESEPCHVPRAEWIQC